MTANGAFLQFQRIIILLLCNVIIFKSVFFKGVILIQAKLKIHMISVVSVALFFGKDDSQLCIFTVSENHHLIALALYLSVNHL